MNVFTTLHYDKHRNAKKFNPPDIETEILWTQALEQ